MSRPADVVSGDFELTMDEIRVVTRYVLETAEPVLVHFERVVAGDPRPRHALEAARVFVEGQRRTRLQRTTSLDAHRAAAAAPSEVARLAAQAAGDAASAAYLHPIAKAHQVGHLLRAAAGTARIAELLDDGGPEAAERALLHAERRAGPTLVDVLRRYPAPPQGRSRVPTLMHELDRRLRAGGPDVDLVRRA